MACACTNGKWVVTTEDGTKHEYRTQMEASAAARRLGGTYQKLS